jgi:hypothetical protein
MHQSAWDTPRRAWKPTLLSATSEYATLADCGRIVTLRTPAPRPGRVVARDGKLCGRVGAKWWGVVLPAGAGLAALVVVAALGL